MEDGLLVSFYGEMAHRKGRILLHKRALGDFYFLGADASQPHSGPLAFGKAGKFRRREFFFDPPGFQVNDPVGKPGQIGQPVFGNQHGMATLFNDFKNSAQLPHCLMIQICRRFIEDINLRIHGIYRSESKQLLLSAGQGENASVRKVFDFEISYGFRYSFVHGIPVCADVLQPEGDLGRRVGVEKLRFRVLKDRTDRFGDFVHGRLGDVQPLDRNSAVNRNILDKVRDQPVYKARQRRFAAAALSAKENKLSVVYRQINVIQNSAALYCGAYILKLDHSR